MAQHDYVLDNAPGASIRSDLNNAMAAIASTNKGNTRPATVYAGQMWIDDNTPSTTVWSVYYWDGSNDIKVGEIDTTANNWMPFVNNASLSSLYATIASVVGKQTICIPASAITPRRTNGCASVTTVTGATNQPDVPYLAFDGAANEYGSFLVWMPKGWNESTVTAQFAWRRASGTSAANVVWGIRAVAVSNSDTPAVNFGTAATVVAAADTTTADFTFSTETGACTIGGSPAENDLVFFEVYRDAASGSDTLDGVDAWLTAVRLFYTTNAATDA
jgi:hypothetical protein